MNSAVTQVADGLLKLVLDHLRVFLLNSANGAHSGLWIQQLQPMHLWLSHDQLEFQGCDEVQEAACVRVLHGVSLRPQSQDHRGGEAGLVRRSIDGRRLHD